MSESKTIATYLYGRTTNNDWPDVVNLVPAGDLIVGGVHRTLMPYMRYHEAKAQFDRLEKTILALVAYIERDGDLLTDAVPHFARMLADMGLYDLGDEVGE